MKKIMLAMLAICLTSITKAQFYTSEVFFYLKAGTSLEDRSDILIVHFDGKNMAKIIQSKRNVSNNLKESRSHWNNYMLNQDHTKTIVHTQQALKPHIVILSMLTGGTIHLPILT